MLATGHGEAYPRAHSKARPMTVHRSSLNPNPEVVDDHPCLVPAQIPIQTE